MAPTIVLKNGKPFLALGSPGGSTIITTVLQILVDRLDRGMTLPQAIAAPRASQRNGVDDERRARLPLTARAAALEARGHHFIDGGEIGAATGIEFLAAAGCSRRPSRCAAAAAAQWSKSLRPSVDCQFLDYGRRPAGRRPVLGSLSPSSCKSAAAE